MLAERLMEIQKSKTRTLQVAAKVHIVADTIVNSAADSTAQEAALIGGSMQTSIGYASIGGDSGNESTLREHLPVLAKSEPTDPGQHCKERYRRHAET